MDITEIKPKIKKLAEKYGLSLVLLFGSRAAGKIHVRSDFDVAYLSKSSLDLYEEAKLICDLMPIFHSEKVDIVNLKKAPPLLMKRIFDQHQVLFCADNAQYFAYQMYALKRYIEAKPLLNLKSDYVHNRIKKYQKELQHV
jgi:predicted nucleotidyltransferase